MINRSIDPNLNPNTSKEEAVTETEQASSLQNNDFCPQKDLSDMDTDKKEVGVEFIGSFSIRKNKGLIKAEAQEYYYKNAYTQQHQTI